MIRPILFFILFIFCSQIIFAQGDKPYTHTYKSKKAFVNYSFRISNDSLFCVGTVLDKSSKSSININIYLQGTQIGTVSNLQGIFKIYLPREEGKLIFDKIGEFKFEMDFTVDRNRIKEEELTSH